MTYFFLLLVFKLCRPTKNTKQQETTCENLPRDIEAASSSYDSINLSSSSCIDDSNGFYKKYYTHASNSLQESSSIEEIPTELDFSVENFDNLRQYTFDNLREYTFLNYQLGSKMLEIRGKVYNSINMRMFKSVCSSITTLVIVDTSIDELPFSMFQYATQLQYVILQNNVSMSYLPNSFYNLMHLKELEIDKEIINYFPLCFKSLETLKISNNPKFSFSTTFKHLKECKSLKSLTLNNNNLNNIPDYFIKFEKLQTLNLAHNLLTDLSDSFVILFNTLTSLDLSYNSISSLENTSKYLQFYQKNSILQNLTVSFQNILSRRSNLKHLNLSNNCLSAFSGDNKILIKLEELKELNLSDNNISRFPVFILAYPNIKQFNISKNNIKSIPEDCNLSPSLKFIDISSNPLEKIPSFIYHIETTKY